MRRPDGFTLMELMIVLTVAGLVLGFGLPAFSSYRTTLALDAARQQLIGDMRSARQFAVTRRSPVYVTFGTPPTTTNITTYQIHVDGNANGALNAGERLIIRSMPKTTSLATVSLSPMDTMGEVRPPARLDTTIVLPSNPTLRWKRKFFNYLRS